MAVKNLIIQLKFDPLGHNLTQYNSLETLRYVKLISAWNNVLTNLYTSFNSYVRVLFSYT